MKKAYMDIETTGLSFKRDKITVVGFYDPEKENLIQLVRDKSLDSRSLERLINEIDTMITFNGKRFDVPFLERKYSIERNFEHKDVCMMKSKIGLKGGLKEIERKLGVEREEDIDGMKGGSAPELWRRYRRKGDREAMKKLLKYNRADLEKLHEVHRIIRERVKSGSSIR